MACIKVPKSVCGSNDDIKTESTRNIIQTYTEWVNHYLERGGYKRRVQNLQTDLCDGVLLADLVEAVTNQKVIDINRKPKNIQQMVDNVSLCISTLRTLGADVGAVNPGELAAGSTLRPILALLFALSRHKQRTKQLQDMPKLPSPYNKQTANGSGTSIPLPATVTATRRCPPDKVRPIPSTAHQTQLGAIKHGSSDRGSASSSRSTSPSQQQQSPHTNLSLIPQPKSQNGRPQPSVTSQSPRSSVARPSSLRAPPASPYASPAAPAPVTQSKNSVLDKFKLFNIKEKSAKQSSSGVSKRTSSSSGFSSARSEHSDSSMSLCEPAKSQTKTLKSKQQIKLKQISPKALRKEQAKATKQIARAKAAEKLFFAEDAKSTKVVCSKGGEKLELAKPQKASFPQPPSKSPLPSFSDAKCTTELPDSVPEPKTQTQSSLSKDVLKKSLVPNGFIAKNQKECESSNQSHIKSARKNLVLENLESSQTLGYEVNKSLELDVSVSSHSSIDTVKNCSQNSSMLGSTVSSIPKPTALVKGTSKPSKENAVTAASTPTKTNNESMYRKRDSATVALVSPMPSISDLINGSSNAQNDYSSTNKIVNQEAKKGRKTDDLFNIENDLSDNLNNSNNDEEDEINIKPMEPLLRGYTPNTRLQTLPNRTSARQYTVLHSSSHQHVNHDYADIDIASGYLSDGEILRTGVNSDNRTSECDGYTSESGSSFYRRSDDRYGVPRREGVASIKEAVTLRRIVKRAPPHVRADEGYNSAGINQQSDLLASCSGGSDALAELTAEDLASIPAINGAPNHNNSSHHKRVPGSGGIVVGGGTASATPQGAQNNNLVYRVVSSKHPNHVKKSDSSQQTENSAFKQQGSNSSNISNSQQWKKYIEAGAARDRDRDKEATPPSPCPSRKSQEKHRKQTMPDYANGEKPQKVSSGTSTSKVRGVPQNFGYVKRHSAGTSATSNGMQNGTKETTRTAQVSAVPRTKVKVSGGTQTTADLQANSSNQHYKSYSLTGASASQLSQSVRDRLILGSQSLPKPGSPEFTAFFASAHYRDRGNNSNPSIPSFSPRALKPSDGSLSDTCSTYAAPDIQGYYAPNSPYSNSWMRHSNTYTPSGRSTGMGLCEADSVESLGSHRSSLTHARLLMHQRDSTGSPAPPRLNRSNSIRSTKSEKMYPSMMARGSSASSTVGEEVGMGIGVGVEPYYSVPVGSAGCSGQHWSQPTSPTPTHTPRQPPNLYQHMHKDDEIHGSSVSLVSTASSLYSSAEEKQAHEVRKLRRELLDAQEKVHSLTSQLSTNAHVVSAFEQSLSNMTQRLQQLTATAEKKDSELQELRDTIERLRKQSAEASLNNSAATAGIATIGGASQARRHTLGDSESGTTGCAGNSANSNSSNNQMASMARQLSADSVTSLNSLSSACSASSHQKKKGWLRSSFSKAFSRSRKNRHGSVSDAEDCKESVAGEVSVPNSPRLPAALKHENSAVNNQTSGKNHDAKSADQDDAISGSKSNCTLYNDDENVDELKKQLREKDLVLTDIRLEALSSAHQLESLKDTVIKMRNEMLNLKQNNERLQRLVTSKSLTSSQSSLPSDPERRFSMTEVATSVAAMANGSAGSGADELEDLSVPEHSESPTTTSTVQDVATEDTDGKRINVAIYLGSEKTFNDNNFCNPSDGASNEPVHCVIASVCISNKTTWDTLDSTVRRCFKDYVSRIDPVTNLGLGVECVASYHLGEAFRCTTDSQHPELLPCGYLVGHVKTIYLVLSGYSWLAVDTLIPRSIVQRLVSLLTEHRRVILCGPSGTGKSYLAGKLAHALVDNDAEVKDVAAVATFNVDHKSSKELRQYLAHIAERCDSNAADELPKVIILENLQHAASLGELFSGLLGTRHSSCPVIIGTMSQATCSTTNLQLHHNFRWVLCANHMEPVKGFLGRYLRRKLLETELREGTGTRNAEMAAVVEWLSRVWLHLNKFLETHSSSDVTIGPRLFLPCPMEVSGSQVWFTDLWNYSIIPYLVEAVRDGFTLYGRRANSGSGNGDTVWEDPAQFIVSSYPWISTHAVHGGSDALLRLKPEDVGFDVVNSSHVSGSASVKSLGSGHGDSEGDPLLNMLMRLQEAANYSNPHGDNESVNSMDSTLTRHSDDLSLNSSKGVESTL